MSDLHVPDRPGWDCRACGEEWPCPVARQRLRQEHATDPVSVALYAAAQHAAMCVDMAELSAGELYVRCFGWMRSAF